MPGLRWAQCRRVRPVLWDYASERLSEGPMELVEQHLQTCAACRREVASLQNAQNFLSACRAVEEPAPRSDWNALRQRMVTAGVTPISAPDLSAPAMPNAGGSWNPRAMWRMQLLTSMVGGFAAVLLVAGGYGLARFRQTGSVPATAVASSAGLMAHPVARTAPDAGTTQIIASVADALSTMRSQSETAETPTIPIIKVSQADVPAPLAPVQAVPHKREQASERSLAASTPPVHRAGAKRRSAPAAQSFARNDNSVLRFHSYKSKPQERLPEATQIAEATSRYALEHVRPVSSEDSDYSTYVVGAVRPISRDDDHDY